MKRKTYTKQEMKKMKQKDYLYVFIACWVGLGITDLFHTYFSLNVWLGFIIYGILAITIYTKLWKEFGHVDITKEICHEFKNKYLGGKTK